MNAVGGTLLSGHYAGAVLPGAFAGRLGERTREPARRHFEAWWSRTQAALGPASSVRAIADRGFTPLARLLGFTVEPRGATAPDTIYPTGLRGRSHAVAALVALWHMPLDAVWLPAVRHAIGRESRWCICFNGARLRIVDAGRTYGRHYVEFDLAAASLDGGAFATFWALARAEAVERPDGGGCLLDQVFAASARHTAGVCLALEDGVREALAEIVRGFAGSRWRAAAPGARTLEDAFEQSLTIVYRVLFLLFAEARGLVPIWHPIYRDNYSIASLAAAAGRRRTRGLWEALQAISRLAHAGCEAGGLRVTPFNGRLFAPRRTPLAETRRVPDEGIARALNALTTRPGRADIARDAIAYADLGVEQLGTVYEGVLEYSPVWHASAPHVRLERGRDRRKRTGTFYTPRSITEFVVRRALAPLVAGASPEAILALRVLDPAMGSGAFLVSACRYLASAYEHALIASDRCRATDIDDRDRAAFRRQVAQRCLFGVDLNPMAAQLARLSIWLATLAADRPLTFLDHHLRAGDSLLGASLDDLARQPPPDGTGRRRRGPAPPLPLFDADTLKGDLRHVLPARDRLATGPGDSLEAVREKEAALARLQAPDSPLARWRALLDLWCACWFWPEGEPAPPSRAVFAALSDVVLGRSSTLPDRLAATLADTARRVAGEARYFHWTLEFPEAFFAADGTPLASPGFDAVVGNPPWDMLRADRSEDRAAVARIVRFARDAGVYRASGDGHANCYQLFVERALQLVRDGGRLGLVVPSGLGTDHGSADLRRALVERCDTDALIGFENRSGIFPIHRSTKFLILTATRGGATRELRVRFGVSDPAALDGVPDRGASDDALPVTFTPDFLRTLSGPCLTIPEIRDRRDVAVFTRVLRQHPALGDSRGWGARFGRELNASDDRAHFVAPGRGLPVIEGKQIQPFIVDAAAARAAIPRPAAARLLDEARTFARARLAYRDVASATNRHTLIAAIVPAGVVTTHTLFCLKTPLDADAQHFLCAALNSHVADYLVRPQVTTHVTVSIVERLPVPRPPRDAWIFQELAALSKALSSSAAGPGAGARLQALAALLYGLTRDDFARVLSTFPLVPDTEKAAALDEFERL